MSKGREAILALADGRIFRGRAFGAVGEAVGEVVFNTAMTGYQEVLTDPSYKGQLVCMTYPEIGNVGINAEDAESRRVYVEGFIVKEYWERPSNWRSEMPLGKYLEDARVIGIEGIDTRALVRHLRTRGAQEAVISSVDLDADSLVRKAKASPGLVGRDLVKEVTSAEAYDWDFGDWKLGSGHVRVSPDATRDAPMIVALDYGIKLNILRRLVATGFRVKVIPAVVDCRADTRAQSRRRVSLERAWRPCCAAVRLQSHRGRFGQETGVRHLPRTSVVGAGAGRENLQARFWASWRESSGDGSAHAAGRDHVAESWLRGQRRVVEGARDTVASESERQHGRRIAGNRGAVFFRAVPSGGVAGAA